MGINTVLAYSEGKVMPNFKQLLLSHAEPEQTATPKSSLLH